MPRRRERRHQEEHTNHERWLITYADMITLLMVLFIVLFAISQVDQKRFEMLREGMAAGFGHEPSPFQGDQTVLAEAGAQPIAPVQPQLEETVRKTTQEQPSTNQVKARQDAYDEAKAEVARLQELRRRIAQALRAAGLLHDVSMKIDQRGLRVSLVSRHIVFRANLADLSPRGAQVLDVLAPVLRTLPNQIDVAGHTNQVKVKPKYYPTDWELSAARAVTVLRYLTEVRDVPSRHLSAVAYGHERPLVDPAKPGSQALNKRVDIVVLSAASDDVRRLFSDVLRDGAKL
ncbi:MAG: OmpA/MotB family protein [Nocardioides sp.]